MTAQGSDGAVDFAYLEDFAAGDRHVIGEVLILFHQQAAIWAQTLESAGPGWPDVAHTIKGAARGIGAYRLGDLCAEAEAEGPGKLPGVLAALRAAVAEIDDYLTRVG